jgi:hypothetical protein
MAGPSGFVQRFKGKVAFPVGGIWIGDFQVTGTAADLNVNLGWGTVTQIGANGSTIPNSGVSQVTSTAVAVYNLANPVAGVSKVIDITAASTAVLIKASTAAGVTIQGGSSLNGGSTLSFVIKSTGATALVATQIELVGLSSLQYLFMGVYPSTLGHLTFSTST